MNPYKKKEDVESVKKYTTATKSVKRNTGLFIKYPAKNTASWKSMTFQNLLATAISLRFIKPGTKNLKKFMLLKLLKKEN